jgi:hypothetical protein
MRFLLAVAAVTATFCAAGNASAQEKDSGDRKGALIGFATGVGWSGCNSCGTKTGLAYDWHIGWAVSKRVALLLDRVLIGTSDYRLYRYDLTENFSVDAIAVQYWPTDQFWVRGGAGLATYHARYAYVLTSRILDNRGFGATATAGAELVRTRGRVFAMDLQVSFHTSSHVPEVGQRHVRFNRLAGQLGFNWYHRHRPQPESDTGQSPSDNDSN